MCAAMVVILSDSVVVKHADVTLGHGQGVYNLRDFDPAIDVYYTESPNPLGSVSSITLELGPHIGRAKIRTRKHDTAIEINAVHMSAGLGSPQGGISSGILFDETYGHGCPGPIEIVDSNNNTLAVVTHQS